MARGTGYDPATSGVLDHEHSIWRSAVNAQSGAIDWTCGSAARCLCHVGLLHRARELL